MSALTPTPAPTGEYAWPADLLEYAREHKVDGYLAPLLALSRRLFPTGKIEVFLEKDPELADVWFIVYEAQVPVADAPDYLAATRAWLEEARQMVPGPLLVLFVFDLQRVD